MVAPKVAFTKQFLEAYSRLPRGQQKKVRDFTDKFQDDPTQPGINYETIADAVDPKVRSVRLDVNYRVIVVHPPKGDVYLCVWVDNHDEAYRWVRSRRFEVNSSSGVFQIFDEVEALQEPTEEESRPRTESAAQASVSGALFQSRDDEELLMAGVPAVLLPAVKSLNSDEDLDSLAPHLPEDAAEMLYLFAAGYTLTEALEESARSRQVEEKVDVEDFAAALALEDSQRTIKVLESDQELEEILEAPLEQWRIFLHPTQRKLVTMKANGPVRVLGGAGTGKTVVLMHRAAHLVSNVFTGQDDLLLVTTFTRNLALELKANLLALCGDSARRMDVMTLHSWAVGFMRKNGFEFKIVQEGDRRNLMELALSESATAELPISFYQEEWDRVVQAQDVGSRDDYFTARRVGRGIRLSRAQRAAVWPVFERYRELLNDRACVEWQDMIRETRQYITKQKAPLPYRTILADEVQDFTPNELKLLRAMIPPGADDLFLVGDGHQRIYGHETRLGGCGIEIRGRSRRLKLNYRTTEEIRDRAVAILEGCEIDDLDGGVDSLRGFFSLRRGPKPDIRHFQREAEEAAFIVARIKAWLKTGAPEGICLTARTRALVHDRYKTILEAAGIDCVVVERNPESEIKRPGVRLATMHRMKGLEFPRVLVAGAQEGTVPLSMPAIVTDDHQAQAAHELKERCLLYVALTRARDELVVVAYGKESHLLRL